MTSEMLILRNISSKKYYYIIMIIKRNQEETSDNEIMILKFCLIYHWRTVVQQTA